MSTPAHIHIEIEDFEAIPEFSGFTDCCGPCVEESCLAALQHRKPTATNMNAIRARDIQRGWFTPGRGNTVHDVWLDATEIAGVQVTETPFGTDINTIHNNLHDAMLRGNPCVMQIQNATVLPGNEPGVHNHFIGVGGCDTLLGYKIANGDQIPFTGTYWVKWPDIEAAQPGGLLEFHMPTSPVSGGSTVSLPSGWTLSPDEQTLTGPVAGDGKQYTVVGTMRDYVIQYLANGTMRADDMPLEEEQHSADGNRIWQTFNYHRWVFERANTEASWSFFASNIGAALLKGERQIESDAQQIAAADTLVQELQAKLAAQPTPMPTPSPLGEQLIALIRQAAQGGN